MNASNPFHLIAIICIFLLLAACGGGSSGNGSGGGGSGGASLRAVISNAPSQVDARDSFTLDGSSSFGNGATLSYEWRQTSGPTAVLENADTQLVTVHAPNVGIQEAITVTLSVRSASGGSSQASASVTVMPLDLRPVIQSVQRSVSFSELFASEAAKGGVPTEALLAGATVSNIYGTVPVGADGNVVIRVPADAPFDFFYLNLTGAAAGIPVVRLAPASEVVTADELALGFITLQPEMLGRDQVAVRDTLEEVTVAAMGEMDFLREHLPGELLLGKGAELFNEEKLEQSTNFLLALMSSIGVVPGTVSAELFADIAFGILRQTIEFEGNTSLVPLGTWLAASLASKSVQAASAQDALVTLQRFGPGRAGPTNQPHLKQTDRLEFEGRGQYLIENPRYVLFGYAIDGLRAGITGARDGFISLTGASPWQSRPQDYPGLPDRDYNILFTTGLGGDAPPGVAAGAIAANAAKALCIVLNAMAVCPLSSEAIALFSRLAYDLSAFVPLLREMLLTVGARGAQEFVFFPIVLDFLSKNPALVNTLVSFADDVTLAAIVNQADKKKPFMAIGQRILGRLALANEALPFVIDLVAGPQDVRFCAVMEDGILSDEETRRLLNPDFRCKQDFVPTAALRISGSTPPQLNAPGRPYPQFSLGSVISFDASGSSDDRTAAEELSFRFRISDAFGTIVRPAGSFDSSSQFSFTFDQPGVYTVFVEVRDKGGLTDTTGVTLEVAPSSLKFVSPAANEIPLAPFEIQVEVSQPISGVSVEVRFGTVPFSNRVIPAGASDPLTLSFGSFDPAAAGFRSGDQLRLEAWFARPDGSTESTSIMVQFSEQIVLPQPGQVSWQIRESVFEGLGAQRTRVNRSFSGVADVDGSVFAGSIYSDNRTRLDLSFSVERTIGATYLFAVTGREAFTGNGAYSLLPLSDGVQVPLLGVSAASSVVSDGCNVGSNVFITNGTLSGGLQVSGLRTVSQFGPYPVRAIDVAFTMTCVLTSDPSVFVEVTGTITGLEFVEGFDPLG